MPKQTIQQVIQEAAAKLHGDNAARDVELLLMHTLGITRAQLLARPERELTPDETARFDALIAQRATGKPIQYITGVQEFYGLEFAVTPDVLIPRPETEHLVEAVLAQVPQDRAVRIADVGVGSGAIAVALAYNLPMAQVTALDISPAALAVAEKNARSHDVESRIRFIESDLLAACAGERFDVIVANPPYIPENEQLELQVHAFEPHRALFAGATGYEIYERLIPQAWDTLESGGLLAMEMGFGQSERMAQLLSVWSDVSFVNDLQGIPRVVLTRRLL